MRCATAPRDRRSSACRGRGSRTKDPAAATSAASSPEIRTCHTSPACCAVAKRRSLRSIIRLMRSSRAIMSSSASHQASPMPVRKRGRQVDGEGHAVLRQHRIGLRDDILAAAVEGQAGKSVGLWQRDRPPAHFVHRDQIEVPALQRTNRPVEKLRRDFAPPVRLKRAGIARTHALEPQDDAGAAGLPLLQPEVAAEIGELHPGPPQNSDIRRQRPALNHGRAAPAAAGLYYPLLTFPCEGRPKPKIVNNFI